MNHLRSKLLSVKPAHRPLIFGHRGSPEHAAENTLESFLCAFAEGADGVELDVRLTGDGVLVVYHDDALPTGEKLSALARAELLARAPHLPALETVLARIAGRGYLDIELKDAAACAGVVPMAARLLPPDSYVYSSFLPDAIAACRRLAPSVPAVWIAERAEPVDAHLQTIRRIDATGFAAWYETFNDANAESYRAGQIPLFTFTVNEPSAARRLASLGVMGIISDRPADIRRTFD